MSLLDKKTAGDLVRLTIFMVVTTMATGLLVVTIGNLSFADKVDYQAEFVDATGVVKGDDVRIAGVKVGSVSDVEIVDRSRALVTFSVAEETPLSEATHAAIRYRNLVGQRYISLTETIGDTAQLDEGATIPASQTSPALDLTVLFNGFKPLFQALSPEDLNQLSYEIIQVFQGEGGTLEGLLSSTASVTQTLADRDEVIDQLIDNLNEVLVNIGDRDEELASLISSFRTFVGGLKDDRKAILTSLDQISELSVETASLVGRDPQALRRGHQAAAPLRGQHRREQGGARPGAAGAADQAHEGGEDRDLRLVLQLLPLPVQRTGTTARRRPARSHLPVAGHQGLRQV